MKRKVFDVVKFVIDSDERGVHHDNIVKSLNTWALKSHGEIIEIDKFGCHYVGRYLSDDNWEEWEDEID